MFFFSNSGRKGARVRRKGTNGGSFRDRKIRRWVGTRKSGGGINAGGEKNTQNYRITVDQRILF